MESNDVTAGLGKTPGNLGGIFLAGEASAAVEVDTPEFCQSAILEAQILTVNTDKTVFSGRLFISKDKGNIYWHSIRVGGHGDIT